MPMLRTLNLELVNPLDNGEIVWARTKKTQLILRTLRRTLQFFRRCHLSNSKNFENGSFGYQTTTPIPPCGSCRQSIAEYEIKQETPIEIYFMGEIGNIYKSDSIKNLLPLCSIKNSCKSPKSPFIFQFLLEYLILQPDGANLGGNYFAL
jgi:hypothetical protein